MVTCGIYEAFTFTLIDVIPNPPKSLLLSKNFAGSTPLPLLFLFLLKSGSVNPSVQSESKNFLPPGFKKFNSPSNNSTFISSPAAAPAIILLLGYILADKLAYITKSSALTNLSTTFPLEPIILLGSTTTKLLPTGLVKTSPEFNLSAIVEEVLV